MMNPDEVNKVLDTMLETITKLQADIYRLEVRALEAESGRRNAEFAAAEAQRRLLDRPIEDPGHLQRIHRLEEELEFQLRWNRELLAFGFAQGARTAVERLEKVLGKSTT